MLSARSRNGSNAWDVLLVMPIGLTRLPKRTFPKNGTSRTCIQMLAGAGCPEMLPNDGGCSPSFSLLALAKSYSTTKSNWS